jgi:hypothetical protein
MAGRAPIIGLYDYSPTATVSGGGFVNDPATMLDPKPQATAVSGGGGVGFSINLSASANIGLVHFQNLVADPGASVSVSFGTYGQTLSAAPQDLNGLYPPWLVERLGRTRFFIPPAPTVASSVNISIGGSGTAVQIGYVGILSIWQAPIGQKFGWGITVKDLSTIDRVTYGSPYRTIKQGLRVLNLGFDWLRQGGIYGDLTDQVFEDGNAFDAAVIAGKGFPTAGVPFPDDAGNIERQSVGGFINTDQQFLNPNFATWDTSFSIEQM